MSATTTTLQVAPYGSGMIAVTNGGSTWTFGDWVEFIASAAAPTCIAGLSLDNNGIDAQWQAEVDVGVGTAGNEVSIGIIRIFGPNSGSDNAGEFWLPTPISGIETGSRVALRYRAKTPNARAQNFGLYFYENFDSSNQTSTAITCTPLGADAVLVTPNATGWAWSAWVELHAGIGHQVGLIGLAQSMPAADVDIEYQLGSGAAASETPFALLRTSTVLANVGSLGYVMLPALMPLAANTRVSVRLRKTGTDVNDHKIALLYYDSVFTPIPPPEPPDEIAAFYPRRERQFLLPSSENNRRMFISNLEVLCDTGIGLNEGQGVDPQVMRSISRDGGHTWGIEKWRSAGAMGNYNTRVRWIGSNGSYRNGVAKIVVTDPVDWQFLKVMADIEEGSS